MATIQTSVRPILGQTMCCCVEHNNYYALIRFLLTANELCQCNFYNNSHMTPKGWHTNPCEHFSRVCHTF